LKTCKKVTPESEQREKDRLLWIL